ncbi:MAG: hypothetical protein KAH62_03895 [Desulfobacula sp.]|nr:hypothetical protein [Desulfobacula sp.]
MLDDIQKKEVSNKKEEFDIKRVSLFIQDKKKEQLLAHGRYNQTNS